MIRISPFPEDEPESFQRGLNFIKVTPLDGVTRGPKRQLPILATPYCHNPSVYGDDIIYGIIDAKPRGFSGISIFDTVCAPSWRHLSLIPCLSRNQIQSSCDGCPYLPRPLQRTIALRRRVSELGQLLANSFVPKILPPSC
jgi:hypothetical protein